MSTHRVPDHGVQVPTRRQARRSIPVPVLALAMAAFVAGCGTAASPSLTPTRTTGATPGPAATPTGSPAIDHPTGPHTVILRLDEGGGFVPPSYLATVVPYFTLYGDGTVIYRPAAEPPPEQIPGGPFRFPALHVARMTEVQVQELLRAALVDGGLALARPSYENQMVADAPTAIFTVRAGGLDKTVSVYALGIEAEPGPDSAIRKQMAALGERLRAFDQEVAAGRATEVGRYAPDRFRATLIESVGAPAQAPRTWPWPTFGPDAFATTGGGFGFPSKVLSGLEAGLVGVEEIAGGASGILVLAPDGRTIYELALRPLLPEEAG
jgi:hypothetical protein